MAANAKATKNGKNEARKPRLSPELADEILDRTEVAIGKAYAEWKSTSRQAVTA